MRFRIVARAVILVVAASLAATLIPADAAGQEARRRWERMAQIRRDKLDLVLPEAMRENGIDMWITVMKEGYRDPLWKDLGQGYVGSIGYYVFTDRGGERSGAYDIVTGEFDLREFVAERDPQRIGVNTSRQIGAADGLSHTARQQLVETLGEPWASRLVSAEKLVSDFRSRRVASEIAAFAEAGEISREIAERALSNEVIVPGVTRLEDVSWWMMEELLRRGLDTSFGMPSVYVTGPEGIEATSSERIIQRGDLLMIDWGVGYLNLYTDMKRIAYVLRDGEAEVPAGFRNAFERALEVRRILRETIEPGPTAAAMLERLEARIEAAGFDYMDEFNRPSERPVTDVIIGCHSVGNLGHGIGPSIAWFNPLRLTFELRPTNLLSIELFAYTPVPEWAAPSCGSRWRTTP